MKKALLIYNPTSGSGLFKDNLDSVVSALQNGSDFCMVTTVRVFKGLDLSSDFMIEQYKQFDVVIAAGGDGTLSILCDTLIKNKIDIPVGIIPAGTANDFAMHLGMPRDYVEAALTIVKGKPRYCDLGLVNGKHFINVAACGSFANTSDDTNSAIKPKLGVYAYYLTALEKLHTYEPIKIRITYDGNVVEESALLVLILNSTHVGGFANLSPNSSVDDGLLDLLLFRNDGKIIKSAKTFVDVLRGQHLNNEDVLCLQAKNFTLEPIHDDKIYLDIDGDKGDCLPQTISIAEGAIQFICPSVETLEEKNEL